MEGIAHPPQTVFESQLYGGCTAASVVKSVSGLTARLPYNTRRGTEQRHGRQLHADKSVPQPAHRYLLRDRYRMAAECLYLQIRRLSYF